MPIPTPHNATVVPSGPSMTCDATMRFEARSAALAIRCSASGITAHSMMPRIAVMRGWCSTSTASQSRASHSDPASSGANTPTTSAALRTTPRAAACLPSRRSPAASRTTI